jgi:hypothetical protein
LDDLDRLSPELQRQAREVLHELAEAEPRKRPIRLAVSIVGDPPRTFEGTHRQRERAWRQSHAEELRASYAGQWLVLEGDEIIEHGKDPAQIAARAKAKGIRVPYIFYVEKVEPGVVRMGL